MKKVTIGDFLRKKRMTKGYSISHAHTMSGIAYSTIVSWENDAVGDIAAEKITPLLTAYGVTENELLKATFAVKDGSIFIQDNFSRARK